MSAALAEHYRRLPDERLRQIAVDEAAGLTPEALAVLRAEIARRGLAPGVERAIAAQTQALSRRDVDLLVERVRQRPCPACGRADRPLNAGAVARAVSVVVFTHYDAHTLVACPTCLAARARRAAVVTALAGWWGIPWGPIRSVQALVQNARTLRLRRRDDPSPELRAFVERRPGVAAAFAEGEPLP